VRVGFDPLRFVVIERLERADQQHHRDVAELRALLYEVAKLVAILARHEDVCEHQVGVDFLHLPLGQVAAADGDDFDPLIFESLIDHLVNGDAVIGE
jgi:hypothetical protein